MQTKSTKIRHKQSIDSNNGCNVGLLTMPGQSEVVLLKSTRRGNNRDGEADESSSRVSIRQI